MFRGVYGHMYGTNPFAKCDYPCIPTLKMLLGKFDLLIEFYLLYFLNSLGAKDNEVGVMNQLSTNLHFMMVKNFRLNLNNFYFIAL
jgi:hypothetical protein